MKENSEVSDTKTRVLLNEFEECVSLLFIVRSSTSEGLGRYPNDMVNAEVALAVARRKLCKRLNKLSTKAWMYDSCSD